MIKAAGGIVLRHTLRGEEVVVVYRKRHQDWTLPKGKLHEGESFEEAALREVEEETGCSCRLGSYLGGISYAISGVPKVVMFWKMAVLQERPVAENDEIGEALWMSLPAAIQRLSHAQEKSLLSRIAGVKATSASATPSATATTAVATGGDEPAPRVAEHAPIEPAPALAANIPIAIHVEPAPIPAPAPIASAWIETATAPAQAPQVATQSTPLAMQAAPNPAPPAPVAPQAVPATKRTASSALPSKAQAFELPASELTEERVPSRPQLSREDRGACARLGHELEGFKVELAYLESRATQSDNSWRAAAKEHIVRAERCLDSYDVEGALASLRSARRYAVMGLNPAELAARAQVLREEARKFSSWRAVAIQRLLAVAEDKLTPARVADAMGLRDEAATDQHLRARIVNDRTRLLAAACGAGALILLLSLPVTGVIHEFAPLAFLGLVGASLAAIQMLIAARSDGKLPNRLVLLALVICGAAAALAADVIYQFAVEYFKFERHSTAAVFILAFALGYVGERILAHFAGYSRERTSSGPY